MLKRRLNRLLSLTLCAAMTLGGTAFASESIAVPQTLESQSETETESTVLDETEVAETESETVETEVTETESETVETEATETMDTEAAETEEEPEQLEVENAVANRVSLKTGSQRVTFDPVAGYEKQHAQLQFTADKTDSYRIEYKLVSGEYTEIMIYFPEKEGNSSQIYWSYPEDGSADIVTDIELKKGETYYILVSADANANNKVVADFNITAYGHPLGNCGPELNYAYDEVSKTLTIAGDGPMYDFVDGFVWASTAPWADWDVRKVVFDGNITYIGAGTFAPGENETTNLKTITIPKSVTAIGKMAFMNSGLKTVDIPSSVKYIGDYAFMGEVESLTVHEGLEHIGEYALQAIGGQITIPRSVTSIGRLGVNAPLMYVYAGSVGEDYVIEYDEYFTDSKWIVLIFDDVRPDAWYYSAVKYAYENGLITGTSGTTFSPNDPMTRGMLVSVLYRLAGRPEVTGKLEFSDVIPSKYYAKAIQWASENGIVSGYSNGKFGPEDPITREQMTKIFYQFVKLNGGDVSHSVDVSVYKDADQIASYAARYVKWAVADGILKGSNGKLNPRGNATRAEVAAIMKRVIETYNLK